MPPSDEPTKQRQSVELSLQRKGEEGERATGDRLIIEFLEIAVTQIYEL